MKVVCPLDGDHQVILEEIISSQSIITLYKKDLDISAKRFFERTKNVSIYKCLNTGYRFYSPTDLGGDGWFYEELQRHPWYYMDWKWEHEVAKSLIGRGEKILEVGCANGTFLSAMEKRTKSVGLELNEQSVEIAKEQGLNVIRESIQNFSQRHQGEFDTVAMFQVLEHIGEVRSFLDSSIKVLKRGGKLFVSVPNNDSFIFETGGKIALNMPPHHMGLWTLNSLIKLARFFPITVNSIHLEPLQNYHEGYATRMIRKQIESMFKKRFGISLPLIEKLTLPVSQISAKTMSPYIIGHSVLIEYIKK